MVTLSTPSSFIFHDNHTAPGAFTERSFNGTRANFLLVRNTDSTNSAQLSFDGQQGFTLKPGELMTIELLHRTSYWTKATAGSPTLEVMFGTDRKE